MAERSPTDPQAQGAPAHLSVALAEVERLRSLLASLPIFVIELSLEGRVVFVNRVLPDLRREQVIGSDWLEWVPEPFRPEARRRFERLLSTRAPQEFETQGHGPGGRQVWYLTRLSPNFSPDGALSSIGLITDDIDARKQAALLLAESEERFRALIEQAPMPIGIHRKGASVYANRAFLSLYGLASVQGVDLLGLVAPESRAAVQERIRRRIAGLPAETEYEYLGLRADGSTFPCSVKVVPAQLSDGPATLVFHTDLTERRDAEEARRQAELQLHQAQKLEALGTLSGGIAHDFNNLLAVVLVDAEALLEQLPQGDERLLAQEIHASAERARELVRSILTFARKQEPARSPAQLELVVAGALKLIHAPLSPRVSIQLRAAAGLPEALVDEGQLHQVILNLATNAAHAMGSEGGALEVSLEAVAIGPQEAAARPELRSGRFVRLTVRDSGAGMDEATQKRIFEPFFTTKPVGQGTGLGLSIVHGIVARHEGFITVESRPGQGAAFHLFFPALEGQAAPSPQQEESHMSPAPNALRVLLVDDEELVLRASGRMLVKKGLQVTPFASPLQALEAFCAAPADFDCALIDLAMPEMSGLELATRLTAARPGFPVLLASGNASALGPDQARKAGIRDVVGKPYDAKTLLEAVQKATAPVS
jgi:PAS domain S-box-containing protein